MPCLAWNEVNRSTIVSSASSQLTGTNLPFLRNKGCLARPGASRMWCSLNPFGQNLPTFTGCLGSPAHRDGFAVFHSDQHAASDRAVSASGGNPLLRNARLRDMAEARIFVVGILFTPNVDTQDAAELCLYFGEHASSLARLEESKRHVERHDRDEEDIAGANYTTECGDESKRRLAGKGKGRGSGNQDHRGRKYPADRSLEHQAPQRLSPRSDDERRRRTCGQPGSQARAARARTQPMRGEPMRRSAITCLGQNHENGDGDQRGNSRVNTLDNNAPSNAALKRKSNGV